MTERNRRKNLPIFSDSDESDQFIITEPECIEIASGYSISVKYDQKGRPLICVKKYGDVDTRGLRRIIERSYPGASIRGLAKPKPIKFIEKKKGNTRKHSVKNRKKNTKHAL